MSAITIPKERAILFKAAMVRAIQEDRKTQTRRIVKPQPSRSLFHLECLPSGEWRDEEVSLGKCPYGKSGDELFVKETWRTSKEWDALKPSELPIANEFMVSPFIAYEADGPSKELHGKTRVSIFMPRWASRITLQIESVRAERLQDITDADAKAEGIGRETKRGVEWFDIYPKPKDYPGATNDPRMSYRTLWEDINGTGSWERDAAKFVWVLKFRRI